jgi:hypothetical protein
MNAPTGAVSLCICKVTGALLLSCNAQLQTVVDVVDMKIMTSFSQQPTQTSTKMSLTNMKPTTSMRIRASRFLTDRYAYRERPDYLIELVAFGIVVITTLLSLATAMATLR